MRKFVLNYLIPRIGQYFLVIFLGVTLTFIIPRLSPERPGGARRSPADGERVTGQPGGRHHHARGA